MSRRGVVLVGRQKRPRQDRRDEQQDTAACNPSARSVAATYPVALVHAHGTYLGLALLAAWETRHGTILETKQAPGQRCALCWRGTSPGGAVLLPAPVRRGGNGELPWARSGTHEHRENRWRTGNERESLPPPPWGEKTVPPTSLVRSRLVENEPSCGWPVPSPPGLFCARNCRYPCVRPVLPLDGEGG